MTTITRLHKDKLPLVAVSFGEQIVLPTIPQSLEKFLLGASLPTLVFPLVQGWLAANVERFTTMGLLDHEGSFDLAFADQFLRAGLTANGGEVTVVLSDLVKKDDPLASFLLRLTNTSFTFDQKDVDKLMAIARAAANE